MTISRVFAAFLVLIVSLALSACKATKGPRPASSSVDQNAGQMQHSLSPEIISQARRLAHDKWWEIEKLPGIAAATTRVFGKQVDAFLECDTGNAIVNGNLLVIDAHKPHDASDGTVFTIDLKTGDAAGALYSEAGTTIFLGDYPDEKSVPHVIEDALRGDGDAPQPFRYESGHSNAAVQTATGSVPEAAAVIEKSSQFGICRVQEMEFARFPEYGRDVEEGTCNGTACQFNSLPRYQTELRLLYKAGYIRGGAGSFEGSSNIWWMPTTKGLAAIGSSVRQEKVAGVQQDMGGYVDSGTDPKIELTHREVNNGFGVVYKWTLILGCRQFQQVDATTALADGQKVDFSWHWKPTDLGVADGLTDGRQRGVAYLTRSNTGLVVDRIQIDSGNGH